MMNSLRFLLPLFFGIFLAYQARTQGTYQLGPESTVTIHGTSTLHDWKAVVADYEGTIELTDALAKKKIKPGPAVESAVLKFKVATIDGGRGPSMNKKIMTALKSEEHPQIVFELSEPAAVTATEGDKFTLQAKGQLNIAGASQQVTLDMDGQRKENGQIHFTTEKPLKMSDFKIEPPSAMFGQIVTKDDIKVSFDIVLSPKS